MSGDANIRAVFAPAQQDAFFAGHQALQRYPGDHDGLQAAWFFSECARLAYQQDEQKRRATLAAVGWCEHGWYNAGDLAAGIWCHTEITLLVFRGTCQPQNWQRNFDTQLKAHPRGGRVHNGFYKAFQCCWTQLQKALPPQRPLLCCGHSLGAAMASIAMLEAQADALYIYGSPRPGDQDFADLFDNTACFRYCTTNDAVTHLPPSRKPFTCAHIGEAIWLGTRQRKRDRFKARLRHPQDLLRTPSQLSDHAPITYTRRLGELLTQQQLIQ